MDPPPLHLAIVHLTPYSLFPTDPDDPPIPLPVPSAPVPPAAPPPDFILSPTHAYPSPYGTAALGALLSAKLRLTNTRPDQGNVLGVKMMLEVQSPSGRFRLGEVIHGEESKPSADESGGGEGSGGGGGEGKDSGSRGKEETPFDEAEKLPELPAGEFVELEGGTEIKELGLHVVIMSVAWETLDGRRTFQRFLKFNVNPPLSIKTRIQLPSHPSAALHPQKREQVHLEILMQNTSPDALLFDRVILEPVHGLLSESVGKTIADASDHGEKANLGSLMPGDTRQYLFVLSPSSDFAEATDGAKRGRKSTFPPAHAPGTILPLGRLDVSWLSGVHRDPGRLQTSTLNRRVPVAPPKPIQPTRTSSAAPPGPAPPNVPPKLPAVVGLGMEEETTGNWEYDLVVLGVESEVGVEKEFDVRLRMGIRGTSALPPSSISDEAVSLPDPALEPPQPIRLAIQHLTSPPPSFSSASPSTAQSKGQVQVQIQSPSRSGTPMTPSTASSTRPLPPFSPLNSAPSPARAMTPVSRELRQAAMGSINLSSAVVAAADADDQAEKVLSTFPPRPFFASSVPASSSKQIDETLQGEVAHLGASLVILPQAEWYIAEVNTGTTYVDSSSPAPRRWEAVSEFKMRFLALEEGLAGLGGLRVLKMDGEGEVGREWSSLGDVWVHD